MGGRRGGGVWGDRPIIANCEKAAVSESFVFLFSGLT